MEIPIGCPRFFCFSFGRGVEVCSLFSYPSPVPGAPLPQGSSSIRRFCSLFFKLLNRILLVSFSLASAFDKHYR